MDPRTKAHETWRMAVVAKDNIWFTVDSTYNNIPDRPKESWRVAAVIEANTMDESKYLLRRICDWISRNQFVSSSRKLIIESDPCYMISFVFTRTFFIDFKLAWKE